MNRQTGIPARRVTLIVVLSWLSMLGFDLLLHGGVLARFYVKPSPFLLPPQMAFRYIPLGYLSFLILAILLVWLMVKLDVRGWRVGFLFGLKLGALFWGAMVMGLMSISTAEWSLLFGWFCGQTLELATAGLFAGLGLGGMGLFRLFLMILAFVILMFVVTVVLQSTGIAPTIRVS
jgi:hypothetical protein